LAHLLPHIRRHERNGRLYFGHHTLRFLKTIQARLAEVFLLGNRADRVDVLLDIAGYELAVPPHASLQVDKVIRVADGANALGDLLSLLREALIRLASCFHLLRGLCKTWYRLGGTAGTTLSRLRPVILRVLLHTGELLFSRRHCLCGSTLFGRHRCSDRLAQLMLHMEESW
jgi:hypothetical protein